MNRSTIVKGLIGLTAATAALAAGAAQAQSYGGYNNGAYYDPCARDKTSRSIVGGLLGAGIGAARRRRHPSRRNGPIGPETRSEPQKWRRRWRQPRPA